MWEIVNFEELINIAENCDIWRDGEIERIANERYFIKELLEKEGDPIRAQCGDCNTEIKIPRKLLSIVLTSKLDNRYRERIAETLSKKYSWPHFMISRFGGLYCDYLCYKRFIDE